MKKTLVLLIALFIFTPLCHGADIYVNGSTGTDSGSCGTVSTPCKTVDQGVTNAGSGTNTIKITVGSYSESIAIRSSVAGLTLQGGWNADFSTQNCDPNLTVLHFGNSYSVMYIEAASTESVTVTISCLTFKGSDDTHRKGIELHGNEGTLTFEMTQSIIDGFAGTGMYVSSNSAGTVNVAIQNTIFKNAYQPVAESPWTGGGIEARAYSGSKQTINLENCLLFNNEASNGAAIHLQTTDVDSSIELSLTNATLSGNVADSDGGGVRVTSFNSGQTTVNIKNSIIWGNSAGRYGNDILIHQNSPSSATVNVGYSIIGEVYNSSSAPGTYNDNGQNSDLDPKLSRCYHLSAGSPAIDAAQCGFNAFGYRRVAPYDDIDGDNRPGFGEVAGCDIGADEYRGAFLCKDESLCFPVKSKNGKVAIICM